MRQGRCSKPHELKGMDQIDNKLSSTKLKEEPSHLSGAYIRSLVKQLTSSKTKIDSMNINHHQQLNKEPDNCVVDGDGFSGKLGQGLTENQRGTKQITQQPQQHKKQVRRRLHTTRPYQERLLNMAEARREIVTALKFHRAAMKQATEQQRQPQSQPPPPPQPPQPLVPCFEQEARIKSRRNHRVYPSNTENNNNNFSNYLGSTTLSNNNTSFPYHHDHYPSMNNPFSWLPDSPISTLPSAENLNFALPNQALGLNLNFHDFNNIDTSSLYYHNNNNNPSFYSNSASSTPSSSSSPSIKIATDQASTVGPPAASAAAESSGGGTGLLHAAMDDEEMAEIRSIGEQHQMEWNDTMNLVTSAWWFKFLKSMELGGGPNVNADQDDINNIMVDGFRPFDEVMEFPAWLGANETCFQHHFDDYYCSDDYFHAPALPCMDIGEIDGMDGDWLA